MGCGQRDRLRESLLGLDKGAQDEQGAGRTMRYRAEPGMMEHHRERNR